MARITKLIFLINISILILLQNKSFGQSKVGHINYSLPSETKKYKIIVTKDYNWAQDTNFKKFTKSKPFYDSANIYTRLICISKKTGDTIFNIPTIDFASLQIMDKHIICISNNYCKFKGLFAIYNYRGDLLDYELEFKSAGIFVPKHLIDSTTLAIISHLDTLGVVLVKKKYVYIEYTNNMYAKDYLWNKVKEKQFIFGSGCLFRQFVNLI